VVKSVKFGLGVRHKSL